MNTENWTVDDHIAWIRQYASSARVAARMVVGWHLDALGVAAGTVEVVPWPSSEEIMNRRSLRRNDIEPKRDPNVRVIHTRQGACLVRDAK